MIMQRILIDHFSELFSKRAIVLMIKVFTNGPEDWGSSPGRVVSKTQKMVLDVTVFYTQHYKVQIKGKVAQELTQQGFHWIYNMFYEQEYFLN